MTGINNNPFYTVDSIVDRVAGQYTDPSAQALLEASIWEYKGNNTLLSCMDKDQDSPFVQEMIKRGEWMLEVAEVYLTAAAQLEGSGRGKPSLI